MRIRPPATRSRRPPASAPSGSSQRRICLWIALSPDHNLVLATNPAREALTPVLSSTCNFSEYARESARRWERFQSFAINVAGALRLMMKRRVMGLFRQWMRVCAGAPGPERAAADENCHIMVMGAFVLARDHKHPYSKGTVRFRSYVVDGSLRQALPALRRGRFRETQFMGEQHAS